MKRIIVADDQGFCWGVRRALDIVDRYENVFILGDLIHNKQVVQQLEKNGKKVIHEITGEETNPIVITAHGTIVENFQHLKTLGLEIVDTTCPLVSVIYRAGKSLEKLGYRILIIGNKEHVEVKGIASRMSDPIIVNDEQELSAIELPEKVGVICQSTYSEEKFDQLVASIDKRTKEIIVKNTTCSPTKKRRMAAEKLAQQVDIMIVIGGYHSSNTKKLAELTSKYVESHHVETPDQLDRRWFEGSRKIGITSGASTADWIVEEICRRIRKFELNQ